MDGGGGNLRIVVFPWLAFGHMMPFLELSKSLAKRGHHIYFISTPRNIQRLPKLPPQLSPLVHFVPLPLPPVDGLPENAEATSDIPYDLVQYLKKALDGLESPFASFMEASSPKPDWIIQDFAHHWVPRVATEFGVPCAFFSVFITAALAFFGPLSQIKKQRHEVTVEELTLPRDWFTFPTKVAYRLHEARQILDNSGTDASGVSDAYRFAQTLEGCKVVAPRSCNELESEWLSLLQDLYKKPVIPVGLLAPPPVEKDDAVNSDGELKIMEWLDQQSLRSVVYVAFGSEATLSTELMHELALGIELSNLPFLWALRTPANARHESSEMLPEGFEERTRGRGVVAMGWVPQLKVLAHSSVGGFLTHCGWSSVIESLQFGHPLILLPIFGDQGINARVIEEKKIGVEVQRNEEDGSFTKEVVAKALRFVVVEEEGEPFRDKAKQMGVVFADKSCHERYVDDFIQFLRDHRNNEG